MKFLKIFCNTTPTCYVVQQIEKQLNHLRFLVFEYVTQFRYVDDVIMVAIIVPEVALIDHEVDVEQWCFLK